MSMASGQPLPLEPWMEALSLSAEGEQSQEAVNRLTALPNDVIDLIISKLTPGTAWAFLHSSKAFTLSIDDFDDTQAVLDFPRPIKRLVLNCYDVGPYVPGAFERLGRGTPGRLQAVEELCFERWQMEADDCPMLDLRGMAELIQTYCPSLRRLELKGCGISMDLGELLQHFASPPKAVPLREVRIAYSFVDNLYVSSLLQGLALLEKCLKVLSLDLTVEPEQSEYDEEYLFTDPVDLQPVAKLRELEFLSIEIAGAPVKHLFQVKQSCRQVRLRRTNVKVYQPAYT